MLTCTVILRQRIILALLQPSPELVHLEPPLARLLFKQPGSRIIGSVSNSVSDRIG
jgi:hypothetical protein